MKCAYHPRRNAVAACVNCGKLICAECKSELGGKSYCTVCANEIFVTKKPAEVIVPPEKTEQNAPAAEVLATTIKPESEPPATVSDIKSPGKNWFERHLNWTFGIVSFLCVFLAWRAGISTGLTFLGYLLYLIMVLAITVWYIRQKSRIYRHLLWLIIPVMGQIALLFLANHRTEEAIAPGISSTAKAETTEEEVKATRAKLSAALAPEKATATAKRIKIPKKTLLAVIGGVAAVAVIMLIVMLIPETDYVPSKGASPPAQSTPVQSTPTQPALQTTKRGSLSSQQRGVIELFGWPQSFSILETEDDKGIPLRYETWTYYDGQTTYIFLDGVFQTWEEEDKFPVNTISTPYHPDQFLIGASPDEVRALTDGSDWLPMPFTDVLLEGIEGELEVYCARQLVAGFLQGRLVFIEATAIVPEGGE